MARKSLNFNVNPLLGGPSLDQRARSGNPYRELKIADIDVDPDQPRRVFDPEALDDLAKSIKQYGVLSPILVRSREGGTFRLVAGERRLRASKLAGLTTIPAVIDHGGEETEDSILPKQLIENLQREDLNPLERSVAMGHLRKEFGWSIREIAAKLGVSKGLVQRSLEILGLADDLKEALATGASESKVLMIGQVSDGEFRKELLAQIDSLSRDQLREEIRKGLAERRDGKTAYRGGTETKKGRSGRPLSVEDKRIAEEIQHALGMKVELIRVREKDGQGKLNLHFYSDEDLYEIYKRLVG